MKFVVFVDNRQRALYVCVRSMHLYLCIALVFSCLMRSSVFIAGLFSLPLSVGCNLQNPIISFFIFFSIQSPSGVFKIQSPRGRRPRESPVTQNTIKKFGQSPRSYLVRWAISEHQAHIYLFTSSSFSLPYPGVRPCALVFGVCFSAEQPRSFRRNSFKRTREKKKRIGSLKKTPISLE